MLYSARSRKTGVSKTNDSGSKNSKDSNMGKSKKKVYSISQTELKLREAINMKYEKSKIKNYQYVITNITNTISKSKNKINQSSSQNSRKMSQYSSLIGQRFINLKEYLNKNNSEVGDKKNLLKKYDNKKTIKSQQDIPQNSKIYQDILNENQKKNTMIAKKKNNTTQNKIYQKKNQNRTIYSGQKNQRQWKIQYHSATKYNQFYKKNNNIQQEQPKSKLNFLRKYKKSPAQHKYL